MSRVRTRGADASALPRWARQPHAADFATAARLAFEASSGSRGDGLAAWAHPLDRFHHALDLQYGPGRWPRGVGRYPGWPGRWRPGREFDSNSYEPLPGGPPPELRAAVDEWQASEDAKFRALLQRRGGGGDPAMLRRHCVPPAGLLV